MIYVRDLAGNEYRAQATITNDYELNGNQSVEATFLPSETNREFIESIAELWTLIDHDGVEHKITYAKRQGAGDSLTVAIQGVPRFFDVLDTTRIYERVDAHMTAMQAFTRIFDGLPFVFVLVDGFDSVQWEGFGDGESRLETFKRALNRYGAEFRIVGNTVYLHAMIGNDTQMQYRHRLNASNIVMENDASAMYTFARGYGDYGDGEGGEDWQNAKLVREYTSPLAQIASVGIRHAPPIKNGNITDVKTMDAALKTLVDESLKISVSADIHDLRAQGYPQAQPELGDRVFLIDERIGLNDEVRVAAISITRNWRGRVIDFKLTFGTPGLSRRYQSQLSSAMSSISDLLAGKIRLPAASVYDEAMRNAVTAIQNAQTELQFPVQGGIIAVDKTNPNKQVWFNSAGLMVSKNGGAGAVAAITGEGVVAETIIGRSIIGVNLTSADTTGYFTVNGPNAEFYDMRTQRSLTMAPDGLYGKNADGSIRFQADRTLVTSTALGTSLYNVYIAGQTGFEARIVDMADIPGDGQASNYRYLPLRAQGIYANYVEPNGATSGVHLYLRPRNGGEVRVTGSNTTSVYYPLRASDIYGKAFVTTTDAAWIGADTSAHIVSKASALGGTSEVEYKNLFARDFWGRAFITTTSNAYIGTDVELRVTNKGMDNIYRDVRALGFIGNRVGLGAHISGTHFHVQPALDGEVQITDRSGNGTYRPIRAREFITDTSVRENKKNIDIYDVDVLPTIRTAEAYLYNRVTDPSYTKKQLGLMLDEMPYETYSERGDGFGVYGLIAFMFRGLKQEVERGDALEQRIIELEGATT